MSVASSASPTPIGLLPAEGRGRGLRQGVPVRTGLTVARTDVVYDEESETRIECPGQYLRFHFKLLGESAISDDRGDFMPVEAGRISLVAQPLDLRKRERVHVDTHERSVTLVCDRDFAAETIAPDAAAPSSMRDFLRGQVSRLTIETLPMPVKLRPIVEDILNPPFDGKLGDVMVEAKALELLCLTVHQFASTSPSGIKVRERDRQRIREICATLERDPANPLNIGLLCRDLAWNETQMMQCFRAVTGTTMSNYKQQILMMRAKRLLEETDQQVTQIAYDMGYEHPSNFATAFKRAFGYPPSLARGGPSYN